MWLKCALVALGLALSDGAEADGLNASRLGVIYNLDDGASRQVALFYSAQRGVPAENVIGIHLPTLNVMSPDAFTRLRAPLIARLPASVQSLLLVWSRPYAVGCMSITAAMAIGYGIGACPASCARTPFNLLFDTDGWLPADTVGWWPAMLLPSDDVALAQALIERGIAANASTSPGVLYLARTEDRARNVRASTYGGVQLYVGSRIRVRQLLAPPAEDVPDAIGYFTGASHVEELAMIHFRPGALADHLTSKGGMLGGSDQMSAMAWLKQGATASYGSVSEPCSYLEKFPNIKVLFEHYLHGETALEAYWKSVEMPSQGLFIGDPLARPFARHEL